MTQFVIFVESITRSPLVSFHHPMVNIDSWPQFASTTIDIALARRLQSINILYCERNGLKNRGHKIQLDRKKSVKTVETYVRQSIITRIGEMLLEREMMKSFIILHITFDIMLNVNFHSIHLCIKFISDSLCDFVWYCWPDHSIFFCLMVAKNGLVFSISVI